MKHIIATAEEFDGFQRKLGWFMHLPKGLYFDVGTLMAGSHLSYHVDGNVFRTSPATNGRAVLIDRHLNLKSFSGWYQLGICGLAKNQIAEKPRLTSRDRRKEKITYIAVDEFPANAINLVVELISESYLKFLEEPNVQPPNHALTLTLPFGHVRILLTLLGHANNRLIEFSEKGIVVNHFNSRFSANQDGLNYKYEAYG